MTVYKEYLTLPCIATLTAFRASGRTGPPYLSPGRGELTYAQGPHVT